MFPTGFIGCPIVTSWLTEGQLNHHVHIAGESGFGETVLISHIIRQRIEQGRGAIFIDLKSDLNP